MVAKIKDIRKKLPAVRSTTRAEVAKKLADGLPIASMKNGELIVEQLIETEDLQFVAKAVAASSIAVTNVKPPAHIGAAPRRPASARKSDRKAASAA